MVSVIYLSVRSSSGPLNQAVQEEEIEQGNAVVREADRREESQIEAMLERTVREMRVFLEDVRIIELE